MYVLHYQILSESGNSVLGERHYNHHLLEPAIKEFQRAQDSARILKLKTNFISITHTDAV